MGAPLGVAYRLDNNTVIRGAWGKFFVPSDLQFPSAPLQAGINFLNNLMVNTTDGQQTPSQLSRQSISDGLVAPPHRNSELSAGPAGRQPASALCQQAQRSTYQWNFAVERQFPLGIAVEAAYSGLHGQNLPVSIGINPLPDSVIAQAAADPTCNVTVSANCFLNKQMTNPYFPLISQGILRNSTVTQNQLLRPFPQYGSISNSGNYIGVSNFDALEVKVQKQTANGGMILGSYTFSKLLTNAEYLTSWLDSTGTAGWQDLNNPRATTPCRASTPGKDWS